MAHEGPDIEDHYENNYFIPKTMHTHSSEDKWDGLWNNHRFKSVKTLMPKPLKDIVIQYEDEDTEAWEQTLDNFYKKHCLSGLSKDKWNTDIERCYYVDSPLENEEFFIIRYSNAGGKAPSYYDSVAIGKDLTIWRAALRGKAIFTTLVAEINTLNAGCSYIGGGGDCVFPDSFISYWTPMIGNGCAYTTVAKKGLSYGSPYGSEDFAYSYSSCGKGLPDNRIAYKNGCNLYEIKDPFVGDDYEPPAG